MIPFFKPQKLSLNAINKLARQTKGQYILGEAVKIFERNFANFLDVKHAIGVASGTDALIIALRILNIGIGDKVIVPANTFIATASAVTSVGATPIIVDVDEKTYNIDPNKVAEAIYFHQPKAIIPVHLYGNPVPLEIISSHGIPVIEDACQSFGAKIKNRYTGILGEIGCFSFYPTKTLGGIGDGGMLVTDNDNIAKAARAIRNYGQTSKWLHNYYPMNSRLDTIQAIYLNEQLNQFPYQQKRSAIAAHYDTGLKDKGQPLIHDWCTSAYHLYVIRHVERDKLRDYLLNAEIQTGIHYPVPLHLHKCLNSLGYREGDFPISEILCNQVLSLPIYPKLSVPDVNFIITMVNQF